MAVASDCNRCERFADAVASALRPIGLSVVPVAVADPHAAIQSNLSRFDLVDLSTSLPYPDSPAFLGQMLGGDVPAAWLPASTATGLARLRSLSGERRGRAATRLARRFVRADFPVIAYAADWIGALFGPRLGCRRWNGVDAGPDLAALCLRGD
jgi:hypothetical protein